MTMSGGSYSDVVFDVEQFRSSAQVSREMLYNTELKQSDVGDRVVLQAVQRVACHDLRHNEVRYPADWWEAFKERWFPAWAKERWPVRYRTERITIKALYPDLPVDVDGRVFIQAFKT